MSEPDDRDRAEGGQDPAGPGGAASEDVERERLEALFERWDQDKPDLGVPDALEEQPYDTPSRWKVDLFHLWVTLTCVIVFLGCWFMFLTRNEVAYWAQRGQPPVEGGDLGERWAGGARELDLASNAYTHLEGMFATLESEGESLEAGRGVVTNFWLCPLYGIVVRTHQPFPEKPERAFAHLPVDEAFIELLERRAAFPKDLTVQVSGTGRLLRAVDAPRWHRDPLLYYARLTRSDPQELWLFIDGDAPEEYVGFAAVWGVAIVMMLTALGLLLRAWLRRRREEPEPV